jgi:hypothetical protein
MAGRETLAMPSFDDALDDFAPRGVGQGATMPAAVPVTEARRSVDAVSQFPSREPTADAQLNLKGPRHVLDRFRALCKADRRTYYDMLEILMDSFAKDPPRP